ncbi:MAG: tetratricopeptide repeat protein [Planctomycetota bacterium]
MCLARLALLALLLASLLPPAARAAPQEGMPPVPAAVREPLVAGDWDAALAALDRLRASDPGAMDTWLYLRSVALAGAGRLEEAIVGLDLLEGTHPEGAWVTKSRFRRAELLRELRRYAEAEEIYEAEARRLLSAERKRELAGVYLSFADELSADPDPGKPDAPPPDYARAYELYRQSLDLGAPRDVRERALFRRGYCQEKAQRWGDAIRDYEAYLAEFDPAIEDGPARAAGPGRDLFEARYRLGTCRLAAGDLAGARRAFEDLVQDAAAARAGEGVWAAFPLPADPAALARIAEHEGRAQHGIARTWRGEDAGEAPLAVAALERFVARFPDHAEAYRAAYEIGEVWTRAGRHEDAYAAFAAFLARGAPDFAAADQREEAARLRMAALYQEGAIRQAQGRFADAIALFGEYVGRYPTGPSWGQAQQAIVDSEYAIGAAHREALEFAAAREAWTAFLERHPLDARAARILFDLGALFVEEAKHARETAADRAAAAPAIAELHRAAIAQWRKVVAKYPGTDEASLALYRIGETHETELGELEAAIQAFRECSFGNWRPHAQARLTGMTTPHLLLQTERTWRTAEAPRVKMQVRNVEKVTVELYRIDLEAYFRKHLTNRNVEGLDLDLIAPDRVLEVAVANYADYAPLEQEIEIPMEGAGVYAVAVIAGDERATTLVVRSDIDVIVKSSRREVFVFAEDMRAEAPAAGVRVLAGLPGAAAGGAAPRVVQVETDANGVARIPAADLEGLDGAGAVAVLAGRDGHFAAEGLDLAGLEAGSGVTNVGFVYTDRPAYRPGQQVSLRAILREARDGRHAFTPGEKYLVEVSDSQGRTIHRAELLLSEFGTLHDSLVLDEYAPVGEWTIACRKPAGGPVFAGTFTVDRYVLQEVELALDVERDVFYRGEEVEVTVRAAWHYGEPVAGSPVRFTKPDGRVGIARTDDEGRARFSFDTRGFPSEGLLSFHADLLEEGVGQDGRIYLALRGFRASLRASRAVVLAGQPFDVTLSTAAPDGTPVGQAMKLSVLRRESTPRGQFAEVLAQTFDVETDAKTGEARRALTLAKGGTYVLRAQGADRFANPIVAEAYVFVSGDDDEVKLRLLAESTTIDVGATATVDAHNRAGAGLALVTFEAETVLDYRLVRLAEGGNEIRFPVEHAHFPNFAVSAAMMRGNELFTAATEFTVERRLDVRVRAGRETYAPGEEATLELEVTDQLGRPARAEVSLAVVDAALFDRYPDTLPGLVAHFQAGVRREAALRTTSSCTFRYEGEARKIDADVLAETRAREEAKALEERRGELFEALSVATSAGEQNAFLSDAPQVFGGLALGEGMAQLRLGRPAVEPQEEAEEAFNDVIGIGGGAGAGGTFHARYGGRRRSPGADEARASRAMMAETALWAPDVVTDAAGRASLSFRLPEESTRWRIVGRGVTADTVLGQAEASFVTRADFFVELRHPGALTEGDRPLVVARVHNATGAGGEANLRLRLTMGEDKRVAVASVRLAEDGVVEHVFDGLGAVPLAARASLEIEASAELGGRSRTAADRIELPVRPWGVERAVSESGVLSSSRTLWLELPTGETWRGQALELYVGPGVRHLLVDEALGGPAVRYGGQSAQIDAPSSTQADAAAELFGACAVLDYLRGAGLWRMAETPRLVARAHGLVARLVAAQREDGGWAWSGAQRESDPATSAYALAALGRAEAALLGVPPATLAKALEFVPNAFQAAEQQADELKAMLQWALAMNDRADFGALNRLHRLRQSLSPAALAYTALALDAMDRGPMVAELVERLDAGELVVPMTESFGAARCQWRVEKNLAWNRSALEMTALALLAIQRARPQSEHVAAGVQFLLSARPWQPARARGFVLAALAEYYSRAAAAGSRGTVVVAVGGKEIERIAIADDTAGRFLAVEGAPLGAGRTRVDLEVKGNAEVYYTATLRGFSPEVKKQDASGLRVLDHEYLAPGPYFRGQEIPTGFGVLRGTHRAWANTVAHLPLGEILRGRVRFYREYDSNTPNATDEYLVLDVPLPAGATVLDGSVRGGFASYEEREGSLRFHVGRHRGSGEVAYDLVGATPGEFRVLPARLQSAYEPDRVAIAGGSALSVLARGETSPDEYRPTPDELYRHGKARYDAGDREPAHALLLALYDEWKDGLEPPVLRDTASMLLFTSIDRRDAPSIVRFFEVLKEKNPDLTIPFEQVLAVGEAYRTIEEHERALLIFRATIEETFGKDLKVAGALEQQGQFLGAIKTLESLWAGFPDLPAVVATYLTIADKLLTKAPAAHLDEKLREAGLDQAALELAGIVVLQRFVSLYPEEPLAPDAGLQLVSAFLGLEDYEVASDVAGRMAARHVEPRFADAFLYTKAVADWYLDRTAAALELLQRIAAAEYTDEAGAVTTSANRHLAFFILGQIHHALRDPRKAIEFYEKVAGIFPDAREAIDAFREKQISLEEVTTVRPGEKLALRLAYRNVREAELLVYSVDLMTLYLREKNLSRITAVNLAGIEPALRRTVPLGGGEDLRRAEVDVDLPLTEAGAYLVICRGDDLHTSGLVLVTPLELDVREEPATGHVRIQVLDRQTGAYVRGVEVKVIGSANESFLSGKTDPRGLFVADAVAGTSTVIARLDGDRYAFYRGRQVLGAAPAPRGGDKDARGQTADQELDQGVYLKNVLELNRANQAQRLQDWQEEVDRTRQGVKVKQVR